MGTFGKALGSFGAYAAGNNDIIQYLMNTSRSFLFSTSLPPAVCAASIAAIGLVDSEPWRRDRLWENRTRFVIGLHSLGISTGDSETPIIPVIIGEAERALAAAQRIFDEGVFAPAIRPPTVPEDSARIRATVMATHSDEDIDEAVRVFGRLKD
jgi:7-keto-8-aminopelargonate synthetase-like enzyme